MKRNQAFKLSDDVVYRVIDGELVLIESGTGTFYHFDQGSRAFFDCFQTPCSLADTFATANPQTRQLLDMLIEKGIMVPSAEEASSALPLDLAAPNFLREGTERLDQVSFLY